MSGGRHCYPNSEVLVNKYNIKDGKLLERLEIQKVAVKLLGLDINPQRIDAILDIEHLTELHKYLFGDIYEWAGQLRDENLYKSEKVLSGGSVEYADYHNIEQELKAQFHQYEKLDWLSANDLGKCVSDFLLELWRIHPFREGNTRTCITFLWHYLKAQNVDFRVELLGNNPFYVRDALVMGSYDQRSYLEKIISDALASPFNSESYIKYDSDETEQYKIAKADYEAFREKYSINK